MIDAGFQDAFDHCNFRDGDDKDTRIQNLKTWLEEKSIDLKKDGNVRIIINNHFIENLGLTLAKKTALKKAFRRILDGEMRDRTESEGTELDDNMAGSLSPLWNIPPPSERQQEQEQHQDLMDMSFNFLLFPEEFPVPPPPPAAGDPYPSVGAPGFDDPFVQPVSSSSSSSGGSSAAPAPPVAGSVKDQLLALISRIEVDENLSVTKQALEEKVKSLEEQVQSLVKTLEKTLEEKEQSSASLEERVKSLGEEKQSLEGQVKSLGESKQSLEERVKSLGEEKQSLEGQVKSFENLQEAKRKADEDLRLMRVNLQKNIEMGRKVSESYDVLKKNHQDQEAVIKELQNTLQEREKNDKVQLELELRYQQKCKQLEDNCEELEKKYKKYKTLSKTLQRQRQIPTIELD
jgi:DNA repair exonuclease SbcCD ATPase subunit